MKPEKYSILWYFMVLWLTTVCWSSLLCVWSATFGPLGLADGISLGGYRIGMISRYWDPLLLGALVTFGIWAYRHAPPVLNWLDNRISPGRGMKLRVVIWIGRKLVEVLYISLLAGLLYHQVIAKTNNQWLGLLMMFSCAPGSFRSFRPFWVTAVVSIWLQFGSVSALAFILILWVIKWGLFCLWRLPSAIDIGWPGALRAYRDRNSLPPGPPMGGGDIPSTRVLTPELT